MPDVKTTPCDYSAAGSPAGCSIALERCLSDLPASLSFLGNPLSDFPRQNTMTYASLQDGQGQCQVMPGCHNNAFLTNLGLRYCSTNSMHPLKHPDSQLVHQDGCAMQSEPYPDGPGVCVNSTSSRLYKSMENLHWTAVSDTSLYSFSPPYKSVDSEFIFRCTATSHWYNNAAEGSPMYDLLPASENIPFHPRRVPVRKDLPLFTKVPQWLFPVMDERIMNGDAKRGLKEKLRLQSARAAEANKPVRPQVALQRSSFSHRITSPEEIKQEVMRRLQLRRQNSTPNLNVHPPDDRSEVVKSHTAESITQNSGRSENSSPSELVVDRKRYPKGRLHIPTFEEFKMMRKKESSELANKMTSSEQEANSCQTETGHGRTAPICTSPIPRSPPQALPVSQGGGVNHSRTQTQNVKDGTFPERPESSEAQSTCCTSLLLDGTDLSSYGAKISKMKDGFIGSALDLIKKSCSAEIAAESPVMISRDVDKADITVPEEGNQSIVVSMTMPACSTETNNQPAGAQPAECQSSPGCRRSSSDAAYDTAEPVRAQRECRLRPHFSDPMPADATKRKQLEMKIAAVVRLHSQRRSQDKDPSPTESGAGGGSDEWRAGAGRGAQQRWSGTSNASSDSGVVGLSADRDEDEEDPRGGARVERADSGYGPALAKSWKPAPASSRAWDSHRPCPDCGHRSATWEPHAGRKDSLCDKCLKLRTERKEAILEFLNTECSYREDLRIIKEEFYCPMQTAGLLTAEQLAVVFSNVQELIDLNEKFTEHLQDSIDQAFDQGDEDLLTVCIGEIFLDFVNMLPAFQTYCLQQSTSVNMLNSLEKEKELLRIFLDVSQNDNTALRRMNLRSFLMAPLQRVTKYPLLLSRISKATHAHHPDHSSLREAKSRVESHLEHINMKTKQEGAPWSLRSFRRDSRRNRELIDIEMREISMKTVGWPREDTRFVMEGQLQLSQPSDGQWAKKGSRALKFQSVHGLLMVSLKRAAEDGPDGAAAAAAGGADEAQGPVRDGVLVLIKDRSSGRLSVLREPIRLGNCVVSSDPDRGDTFELLDIRREAFVFRAAEKSRTHQWFRAIKRYSRELGLWRKRRNALPNIMISTVQNRT
ncbi:MYOM protein, partial [Atractosteus spatula]|nr:MYOM protein [Atractosteus spatula]